MKQASTFSPLRLESIGRILACSALTAFGNHVLAQADTTAPTDALSHLGLTFEPRLGLTETFTSNSGLKGINPQSDQVTEASVGIHAASGGGRIRGYVDYALNGQAHAQGSSANSQSQSLNASGTVVAVDNRVFIDVNGVISQQAVSAFGTQSIGNVLANENLSETSAYRVSPYVRGELGADVNYEARYSLGTTYSAAQSSSNPQDKDLSLKLTGGTGSSRLSWSVDASRHQVDVSAGASTQDDRFNASVTAAVTPQLSLTAIASVESDNYSAANQDSRTLGGWGVNWSPSELTRLSLIRQNRPFGTSHSLSIEHRTGRTVWRLTDSQDVSVASSQSNIPSLGPVYDLFFAQFAAVEADPVKRALLVNQFMKINGIDSNAVFAPVSYLTSSVSVQRQQSLSFALMGVRDTVTLLASRSEGNRVSTLSGGIDDFSISPVVRQRGLSINYAHRLTPQTSLNLTVSDLQSSGANSLQDTSLYALLAGLSTQLGSRTTATLGMRRVVFQSTDAPYDETAITCSLNMRF